MFCHYQYYRGYTDWLQSAVDHSDEKYQCKEMSDCPYTGTNILQKVPWAGQAGADSGSADNKLKRDKTPTLMNKMKNWIDRLDRFVDSALGSSGEKEEIWIEEHNEFRNS